MKKAVEILKPFESATTEMSSQKYVSISKIIPLPKSLQQIASGNTSPLDVRKILVDQMPQRFVNMEGNLLAKATLLDPHFKKIAFLNKMASSGEQSLA